jgi:hypothetical protein
MARYMKTTLTMTIVYNEDETEHPQNWNWHDVLDLRGDEFVTVAVDGPSSEVPDASADTFAGVRNQG